VALPLVRGAQAFINVNTLNLRVIGTHTTTSHLIMRATGSTTSGGNGLDRDEDRLTGPLKGKESRAMGNLSWDAFVRIIFANDPSILIVSL
jgi:hypothetical protein